jgi:succinyl-diaminopimelate desuccinylase
MTFGEHAMQDATGHVQAFLEGERERQERFLAELVRMPSDNPPGDCAPHAERAAALLEGLGFTVERHPVPDSLVRANGMVSATNLVVRHRFGQGGSGGGPVIALNAHGDVVPPGEGWTHDPYGAEIVDGWMHGRGVAVSKSDFATYAWALLALQSLDRPLKGAVELHLTYDEEAGGEIGPAWLLAQGISKPDYAISAGFSYQVVNAHDGCLHLEVEVHGRSAHAARPSTGVDALEAATGILGALYAWRGSLAARVSAVPGIGAPQMTVGLIEGGINTNVVPDRVTFRLDRRMTPEEDPAGVEAELRAVIEGAAGDFPQARVEIRRILLAEPLTPLPGSERLSEALCRFASQIMGEAVRTGGVPLYTDARHYAAAGIPTVLYGAGPRSIEEANAHRADERLPLSDLHKATEVVTLALADLLGSEAT